MSIGAGIASVNAAIGIAKGLRGLEKAYDEAVLKGQLIELMINLNDAKGELLDAQEAIAEREREIGRLSQALQVQGKLLEGPGGYRWLDKGEGQKRGYPVCPRCLPKGDHIEMLQSGGIQTATCPVCSFKAEPVTCFIDPATGYETAQEKRKAESDAAIERSRERFRSQRF